MTQQQTAFANIVQLAQDARGDACEVAGKHEDSDDASDVCNDNYIRGVAILRQLIGANYDMQCMLDDAQDAEYSVDV